jgi:hypothetical protein
MAPKLRTLRDWGEQYGSDFVKEFEKAIFDRTSPNFSDACEVDIARRYVMSFYLSALQLRNNRYVKTKFINNAPEYDGIYVLYDYVQPLESVLNPDYDENKFEKLKKIHPDKRTPEDRAKVRQIPMLKQDSHLKKISESQGNILISKET